MKLDISLKEYDEMVKYVLSDKQELSRGFDSVVMVSDIKAGKLPAQSSEIGIGMYRKVSNG